MSNWSNPYTQFVEIVVSSQVILKYLEKWQRRYDFPRNLLRRLVKMKRKKSHYIRKHKLVRISRSWTSPRAKTSILVMDITNHDGLKIISCLHRRNLLTKIDRWSKDLDLMIIFQNNANHAWQIMLTFICCMDPNTDASCMY